MAVRNGLRFTGPPFESEPDPVPSRVGPDDYGIGQILPEGLGGRSFVVRKGASVPTFHAYPGKVTFVGGIQFFERDNRFGIAPDPSVTLDAVRSFLARKYPLFPHHLQIDYLKIVPAAGGC
jgi:hypothetical protein